MKHLMLSMGALALLAVSYGFSTQDPKPAPAPAPAPASAPTKTASTTPSNAEVIAAQKPSYPLDTCPISGEKLGKDAVDNVKDGHLVRTCCSKCSAKVDAASIKKVEDGVIAAQTKGYPMSACLCGKPLGEKAVNHVVGTRLLRCCSAECASMMDKDPKPALTKLDRAYVDAQLKTYKLTTCPVCSMDLTKAEPVNKLYGVTLVRFCSAKCAGALDKDADAILKKVAAAQ
jgi:ribosomal protein L24E